MNSAVTDINTDNTLLNGHTLALNTFKYVNTSQLWGYISRVDLGSSSAYTSSVGVIGTYYSQRTMETYPFVAASGKAMLSYASGSSKLSNQALRKPYVMFSCVIILYTIGLFKTPM